MFFQNVQFGASLFTTQYNEHKTHIFHLDYLDVSRYRRMELWASTKTLPTTWELYNQLSTLARHLCKILHFHVNDNVILSTIMQPVYYAF